MSKRIRQLLTILAILLSPSAIADDAKSILMITWRGMTPAEQGFMHRLAELGIKTRYSHFDAGRDVNKLAGYLRENRKSIAELDLIYTFGTTATVTVQNFGTGTIPQVFNIVTDPVSTGISVSASTPSHGATGAKMSLAPAAILELVDRLLPYKTIAVLFDPREINAMHEADDVTTAAKAQDKSVVQMRLVPDIPDIEGQIAALRSQLDLVDLIYVTSTSSFVDHADTLRQVLPEGKVSVSSSAAHIEGGVMLAFGDEYWKRGEAAAELAAELLLHNKRPDQVAINQIDPADAVLFIKRGSGAETILDLSELPNKVMYR